MPNHEPCPIEVPVVKGNVTFHGVAVCRRRAFPVWLTPEALQEAADSPGFLTIDEYIPWSAWRAVSGGKQIG